MGLNKKGIRLLADDLVANQKRYNQGTFGSKDECGTVCCLAGFCYAREIGYRKFSSLARKWSDPADGFDLCVPAGYAQLGIPSGRDPRTKTLPSIFSGLWRWPDDLQDEYRSNGPRWRVIAALKALQRLLPDGSIDPDPNAVHTKLSQLTKMLKEKKKAK